MFTDAFDAISYLFNSFAAFLIDNKIATVPIIVIIIMPIVTLSLYNVIFNKVG